METVPWWGFLIVCIVMMGFTAAGAWATYVTREELLGALTLVPLAGAVVAGICMFLAMGVVEIARSAQ